MNKPRSNSNIVGFLVKKSFLTPPNNKYSPDYQQRSGLSRFAQSKNQSKKHQQIKKIRRSTEHKKNMLSHSQLAHSSKQSTFQQNKYPIHTDESQYRINIYKRLMNSGITQKGQLTNSKLSQTNPSYQNRFNRYVNQKDVLEHKRSLDMINQKVFTQQQSVNGHSPKENSNGRFAKNYKNRKIQVIRQKQFNKKAQNSLIKSWQKAIKFQSSKVQARICLSQLHERLQTSIYSIDEYLSEISTEYEKSIRNRLHTLRNKALILVQQTFNKFEEHVTQTFNFNKQIVIKSIIDQKYTLKLLQQKLNNMKQELQSQTNWRKVAGDIISNNLQSQVQKTIDFVQQKLYLTKQNSQKWLNLNNYKRQRPQIDKNIQDTQRISKVKKALCTFFYDQ